MAQSLQQIKRRNDRLVILKSSNGQNQKILECNDVAAQRMERTNSWKCNFITQSQSNL